MQKKFLSRTPDTDFRSVIGRIGPEYGDIPRGEDKVIRHPSRRDAGPEDMIVDT